MPTPIDILIDPITLCVSGLLAALMLWERLAPGRPLATPRGWWPRAVLSLFGYLMPPANLPLLWRDVSSPR